MPPMPLRIAQTSSEAKKQHKKNGLRLPERQQKQLERAYELDIRAARLREAEDRRKAAKKKRDEREEKEKAARNQIGVGLATQLIRYSHTQAQLKSGMEAFLGVRKRKEEEQRERDMELTKKLEAIAQEVEKEPWDDDDTDDIALDLPQLTISLGEQYVDDDLDDDALLEAHDLLMPDPIEEPPIEAQSPPPRPIPLTLGLKKDGLDFVRLHGPTNKAVESILNKLPEPLIELLSQDISLRLPDWDPAPGLLHKLNPLGLPPHRLRIKSGSVVTLLRDFNTSSQLSKSQHLRILRAEKDRLECVVLDGQLEGTKSVLTRVAFPAKYRNDDTCPFQRTQFPIRVATYYTGPLAPRRTLQSRFKLPTVASPARSSSLPRRPSHPIMDPEPQGNGNTKFKMPGLPASKSTSLSASKTPSTVTVADRWDDFLESETEIARELSSDVVIAPASSYPVAKALCLVPECLPPLSTQDLDFSIDDLEEAVESTATIANINLIASRSNPVPAPIKPAQNPLPVGLFPHGPSCSLCELRQPGAGQVSEAPLKSKPLPQPPKQAIAPITLQTLRPSQRPPSVSNRPGLKRKAFSPPTKVQTPLTKRQCAQASRPVPVPVAPTKVVAASTFSTFEDFGISTQEAASFFADDEEMTFGTPPITV